MWHVLLREMQVFPQALPTEQTLQQVSATGVECEDAREVTDRRSGLPWSAWLNNVAWPGFAGLGGVSDRAALVSDSSVRRATRIRGIEAP